MLSEKIFCPTKTFKKQGSILSTHTTSYHYLGPWSLSDPIGNAFLFVWHADPHTSCLLGATCGSHTHCLYRCNRRCIGHRTGSMPRGTCSDCSQRVRAGGAAAGKWGGVRNPPPAAAESSPPARPGGRRRWCPPSLPAAAPRTGPAPATPAPAAPPGGTALPPPAAWTCGGRGRSGSCSALAGTLDHHLLRPRLPPQKRCSTLCGCYRAASQAAGFCRGDCACIPSGTHWMRKACAHRGVGAYQQGSTALRRSAAATARPSAKGARRRLPRMSAVDGASGRRRAGSGGLPAAAAQCAPCRAHRPSHHRCLACFHIQFLPDAPWCPIDWERTSLNASASKIGKKVCTWSALSPALHR